MGGNLVVYHKIKPTTWPELVYKHE